MIEAKAVQVRIDEIAQSLAQLDPLSRFYFDLEYRELHALSEIATSFGNSTQAPFPAGGDRADIVADQNHHRFALRLTSIGTAGNRPDHPSGAVRATELVQTAAGLYRSFREGMRGV